MTQLSEYGETEFDRNTILETSLATPEDVEGGYTVEANFKRPSGTKEKENENLPHCQTLKNKMCNFSQTI